MARHLEPPFHAEHVGSFLRPDSLLDAVRKHRAGNLDAAALSAAQDTAIREIVAFQEAAGLPTVTDGEFRRRSWSAGFIDSVDGFGLREEGVLTFKTEDGELGAAASPYAKDKLRRKKKIVADDYAFLKTVAKNAIPKVTVASPPVMHFFLGPRAVDTGTYPDIEEYYADLAQIYKDEIDDLAALGCTFLQLDDTAIPCNCDMNARKGVEKRGEDPDALTDRYVKLVNDAVSNRPANMAVAMHMCRGNLKGAWMAEGGYEPIAEATFNGLDIDAFLLEYDTDRAGDFTPLRHLPKGKRVILGLISTKTPELESADALKRRIDEAAKYAPLEQLGLGPQCGFSSGGGSGQTVTEDDTKRKLELMMGVVHDVWG
jgi:5-methyltetrahydropteroyltriglutamate--homocysteine methyltransferase